MITIDIHQTYIPLVGVLFVIAGAIILLADMGAYQKRGMAREQAWARDLALIHFGLGGMVLVTNWIAQQWLW